MLAEALRPLGIRVWLPMALAPSKKVTVPSGVTPPPPLIATVAVKVTFWPTVEGFWLE